MIRPNAGVSISKECLENTYEAYVIEDWGEEIFDKKT
jgi:hypothetical protein